jgi:hypothetical protein
VFGFPPLLAAGARDLSLVVLGGRWVLASPSPSTGGPVRGDSAAGGGRAAESSCDSERENEARGINPSIISSRRLMTESASYSFLIRFQARGSCSCISKTNHCFSKL